MYTTNFPCIESRKKKTFQLMFIPNEKKNTNEVDYPIVILDVNLICDIWYLHLHYTYGLI